MHPEIWWKLLFSRLIRENKETQERRESDCKLALHCLHCHQATPIFPHPHIWLAGLPARVCSPWPPSSYRRFPSLSLSPRSVSLHAVCQWMGPVRNKLLNSIVSRALSLSPSLALSVLSHLRSRQSVEHRHSNGATEDRQGREDRKPHWQQRGAESIYNNSITSVICNTVQGRSNRLHSAGIVAAPDALSADRSLETEQICNSSCSCHLLGFESQFPCVKQMHGLCESARKWQRSLTDSFESFDKQ